MKTIIVRLIKNGDWSIEENLEFPFDEWSMYEETHFLKLSSKDGEDIIRIPYERIHTIEIKEI